jgi:hypothetical protein
MVDEVALKNAAETAWTVYRARYPEVHAHDRRRCLLERHLHGKSKARESDTEELARFGIAYLQRLAPDGC